MNILKSKKGNSILTFIIIVPFMAMFMTYFVSSYTFNKTNSYFYNIANSSFDRILVEGQMTSSIENDMMNKFSKIGFDTSKIEIVTNSSAINDNNNSTYVARGEEVKVQILHKKPHYFYFINNIFTLGSSKEETFYIGSVFSGMSEKY